MVCYALDPLKRRRGVGGGEGREYIESSKK